MGPRLRGDDSEMTVCVIARIVWGPGQAAFPFRRPRKHRGCGAPKSAPVFRV